ESGFNRVAWDLRYPAAQLVERDPDRSEVFPWELGPVGPLVMPGKYSVKLSKKVDGKVTDLGTPVGFNVYVEGQEKMSAEDRADLFGFQRKLIALDRAVGGALSVANDLNSRFGKIRRALAETPADTAALVSRVDDLDKQLNIVLIALRGDV